MPQSYELYNGAVTLTFDENNHTYTVDGRVIKDSISGCLKVVAKPALVGWAAGLAVDHIAARMYPGMVLDEIIIKDLVKGAKVAYRQKTEDAADLGTLGHKWVEDYLTAQAHHRPAPGLPVNPQLRNIADTFLQFMAENNVDVHLAEQKVYSRELDIAGTFDCLAEFDGELAIIDWKTGSGIYPEYFLQMGGYQFCYDEERAYSSRSSIRPITKHIIVNCSKTGDLRIAISDQVDRNQSGFKNALLLSRVLENIQKEMKNWT